MEDFVRDQENFVRDQENFKNNSFFHRKLV